MSLSFSQLAFNKRLRPPARLALAALIIGALLVSLVKDGKWTSGWLPPLAAVAVILWVSRSRLAWISILIGILMVFMKADSFQRLLFSGNTYSIFTRLEAWRIIAEIVKVSPWLGLGPSNYYWYTPLYSILGYTVEFNSHNNYVDLVAQVGVLGLLAFLWFAWELWRVGLRLRDQVPAGFQRAFVYGALGGLVGMLVSGMLGDWILPFIYNIGFRGFRGSMVGWIFLGGLLALEIQQRQRTAQMPEESDL
jgi:O-antigen ligase